MESKNIEYRTLKWGPCVVQFKADDEFIESLLADAEQSSVSYGKHLAGHIKKEVKLDAVKHKKHFDKMFAIYNHALGPWLGKEEKNTFLVTDLWCNFQKANEFNPPHDHSGTLSFVIYLKVPELMQKECAEHQKVKTSAGPGCISFFLADSDKKNSITQNSFLPVTGDCFIFPAWLKHWVYPFKSDCTRISVSGNVVDNIPLNLMSNKGIQSVLEDIRKKDQ
jgi:hypothetical protein